jgi:23S rRNA (uracil1939-C5)-methyltransferase
VVRTGFESHEVMVTIVINGKKLPKMQLLADLMYDAVEPLDYELKSLVVNYNSNRSLAEISTKHDVIYGQPVIHDTCAGMEFEISPFSFYQVNSLQMEKLYSTVLEFADLKGTETVFDLYCGVGTIGLYCARTASQVWGIESVKNAVLDANRNAVINGLVNIQFIQGKAEEKIFDLEEKEIKPDLVIMDPPRSGCRPELLEAVLKASPEKIIYVSCDPGTLARDLKQLTADSYKITRIRPVDNFCHSTHLECVVLIMKLN